MNDTPRPDAPLSPDTPNEPQDAGNARGPRPQASRSQGSHHPQESREQDPQATHAETAAQASRAYVDPSLLVDEVAEMKDRLLRTLAEMENLRKRAERDVADARQYGIASFARDILGVADNFRRALETVGPEIRAGADAAMASFVEGVELTEKELMRVLEKSGIRKIEPLGEKFDPNLHQAMFEVPDPSVPSGSVVQVIQPGYVIGERILRPAMVGVSKGGPKAAPAGNDGAGGK